MKSLVFLSASLLLLSASGSSASPVSDSILPTITAPEISLLPGIPTPQQKACSIGWRAEDDYVTTAKNTVVTFSPLANDSDTPQQNFGGIIYGPSNGTAQVVGLDGIRYTPNTGYTGSDSLVYEHIGCLQCFGSGFSAWCSEPSSTFVTVYITVTN